MRASLEGGAALIAPVAPVAELVAVSHRYGRVAALTDVSLSLQPGQITALLGPNGAGKTTAVSLLTGLTRPSAGEARLFGGSRRRRWPGAVAWA